MKSYFWIMSIFFKKQRTTMYASTIDGETWCTMPKITITVMLPLKALAPMEKHFPPALISIASISRVVSPTRQDLYRYANEYEKHSCSFFFHPDFHPWP